MSADYDSQNARRLKSKYRFFDRK